LRERRREFEWAIRVIGQIYEISMLLIALALLMGSPALSAGKIPRTLRNLGENQ
jgi:hypothetical protein